MLDTISQGMQLTERFQPLTIVGGIALALVSWLPWRSIRVEPKMEFELIVGDVTELAIMDVNDRGVANQECIVVFVRNPVNLGRYGLMLAQHASATSKNSLPFFDNLFWFGDGVVSHGDWLFVFTGPGAPASAPATNGLNRTYSLHWGKPHPAFANSLVVPILFRVDAVDILLPPRDQPQPPRLSSL